MSDATIDRRRFIAAAATSAAMATVPAFVAAEVARAPSGRTQAFDTGWRFLRGTAEGGEAPGYDDAAWRHVDLPHDWSIEDLPAAPDGAMIVGPFDRKAPGGTATGFAVGGEGWYRKPFVAPMGDQRVELLFDGVYANSEVWLNGRHLASHANGYTPFAVDLTPHLVRGGANVIAVRVRNLGRNSRWYSGSGLYRHVWLDLRPARSRIARWGVAATTRRIVEGSATLDIETRLEDVEEGASVVTRLRDPAGRIVWRGTASAGAIVRQSAVVDSPRLWSPDTPTLYTVETAVMRGTAMVDRAVTLTGIRIVAFDAVRGMLLNGDPVKLRGGCIHHDNGLLGAAAFDAAEDRKVRLMKGRGYNAVRASHNPFSPAFLDACDRLGMMVIAEAFDMWRWPKTPDDYAAAFDADWRGDLTTMVMEGRHRPAIVMWSIGNEIPHRNTPDGVHLQWELGNLVHELDPTRPVTAAVNDFQGREVVPAPGTARPGREGRAEQASFVFLDVAGYNYKVGKYEADHRSYPDRLIYGSESFSLDMFRTWDIAARSPWLIGDFVWTALDYLGEAGLGGSTYVAAKYAGSPGAPAGWPWVVAACGETDLIGHAKGAGLARDVLWGRSPIEMLVQKPVPEGKVEVPRFWGWRDERPGWTWPGAEGKPVSVAVYTAGDRVTLSLDGRMVGEKSVGPGDAMRAEFTLPYAPGVLEAVAYAGTRRLGSRVLRTTQAPARVRIGSESSTMGAGRGDIAYLPIEIVDAAGQRVGDLTTEVRLRIDGPAELIGFGSADPLATGSFRQPAAKTWDGRALAIIRSTGRPGTIRVAARAAGLADHVTRLRAG